MENNGENHRPKRRRVDKRSAALEKMRNLKGKKNKYKIDELENVYDMVDEDEYAKKVSLQAAEHWIDEDGVAEYIEDGREIFDEEEEQDERVSKSIVSQKTNMKEIDLHDPNTVKLSKYFTKEKVKSINNIKNETSVGKDSLLENILNQMENENKNFNILENEVKTHPQESLDASNKISAASGIEKQFCEKKIDNESFQHSTKKNLQTKEINLKNSTEMLKFWLWDIWEDNVKKPGHLFLFGRTEINGEFISTCIQISNVERCLYLLPRTRHLDTNDRVTMKDVYEEITSITNSLGIDVYKCKTVTKHFAFQIPDVDIPHTSEYLMVRYNGGLKVPKPNGAYKTISYIFGCNSSSTETFLIERCIKGPCWISVSNYKVIESSTSYCKLQLLCLSTSSITVLKDKHDPPPPLIVLGLNLRVVPHSRTKTEIVAISCLVNNNFSIDKDSQNEVFTEHFCLLSHPSDVTFPIGFHNAIKTSKYTNIQVCDSERGLLACFLAKLQSVDPDVIVTQDANARQLDVLCSNLINLKVSQISRIGRLRMANITSSRKIEDYFIGRMIVDVKTSAEELQRLRSFDMNSLCRAILKLPDDARKDIYPNDIPKMYSTTEKLIEFINLTMQDTLYSLQIMIELEILPLALQITNISGNLMSSTLRGGRSERNEWLLLHAFSEKDYIVPDKYHKEKKTLDSLDIAPGKKKAQYAGGLVLDPVKGFYDKYVLLMDFNSLYPSIIQEYNICFTTIICKDNEVSLPDPAAEVGILPKQIKKLVESRRQVKSLLAQPDLPKNLKSKYNIRQKALKLTANSMYGCLGFPQSRFYAQHIASLITQKGREILTNTKATVEKLQYIVVYGDTDSIMVLTNSTNYDEVYEKGAHIKQTVNKLYRHIELDIDGIFKYLLLLKKKKYAALTISKNNYGDLVEIPEFKGLDIVRRDWCKFAQKVGENVLKEILSDIPMEKRVENIHSYLRNVSKDLQENKIETECLQITKQLSQSVGEYRNTAYSLPHVQVAMRMNITMNRNFKKGDVVGYVHPIVTRIIEPLNETDAVKIAECLGLDMKKFKTSSKSVFENCVNTNCNSKPIQFGSSIVNELLVDIQMVLQRFYENWLICNDPLCNNNTKDFSHVSFQGNSLCTICKKGTLIRQFTEMELFNQLDYYKQMFTLDERDINVPFFAILLPTQIKC
uniref:DNA polymerase n=1 Tax=Culicoides sonorensis TaxID=179676 RepID=A0A336MVQ2_CULSO